MTRGRTLHWAAWLALAWQVPAAGADQCGEMEWGGWGQAGPELEQLSTTSVNVSWNNSIPTACASENLFVTYYKSSPYLVFGPENKIENDTLEMVVMQKNFSSVVIEDHIEPGQNYSFQVKLLSTSKMEQSSCLQVTIAVADRNWSSPLSHITIHDDEGKEDNENVDSEGLRRRCERGETAAPDGCACPAGWGGPACAVSHLTKGSPANIDRNYSTFRDIIHFFGFKIDHRSLDCSLNYTYKTFGQRQTSLPFHTCD